MVCTYYPFKNYDDSIFLFEMDYMVNDKETLYQWKLKASEDNIGGANTMIRKWDGAATGGSSGNADYDLFDGKTIIYSRNILSAE